MTTRLRDIIRIDEEKCDGCGACVLSCAEGAIQVVDGKARLLSETYCDGLGACLGQCPQGALTIEQRKSEQFDEAAVERHLESMKHPKPLACGCPSATVQQFQPNHPKDEPAACGCASMTSDMPSKTGGVRRSELGHWPVQLTLVPPGAPFLQGADVLLAAHCAPFAYGDFHQDFIKDHAVLCACPKLDDFPAHQRKLTEILRKSDIPSLRVVRMEVPCCGGLAQMALKAIRKSGKDIPLEVVTLGARGDILSEG